MRDLRNEMYSANKDESTDISHNDESEKPSRLAELELRVKQLERDVSILKSRHTTLK